jgi:hypothetical protein
MSSAKPRFFFEPVSILVGQRVEEPSGQRSEDEEVILESRGELSSQYFFKKIVAENSDDFEVLDIHDEISSLITNAYGSVAQMLREKLSSVISSEMMEILFHLPSKPDEYLVRRALRETPGLLYIHKNSPSLIIPSSANTFCVLSNEAKHVNALIVDIKSKFENLSKVTRDFGLELLKFLTSKDYQSFFLEKIEKVSKIEFGNPKNPFEKEVIEVCSQVTTSFLSNVIVQFKEPVESFEYDVFLNFPPRTRFVVEPTDYETIKEEISNHRIATETLKSKVVLAMLDKAQRLRARGIVVVNGFPDEAFLQLKTIADSRGVILMNEKDYTEKLPSELCQAMLFALSRPRVPSAVRYRDVYL